MMHNLARQEAKAVRDCIREAGTPVHEPIEIVTAAPLAPITLKTGLPPLKKMMDLDMNADVRRHAGPLFRSFIEWLFRRYPGLGKGKGNVGNIGRKVL